MNERTDAEKLQELADFIAEKDRAHSEALQAKEDERAEKDQEHAEKLDAAEQEAALHRTNLEVLLMGSSNREAELLDVIRQREDQINELNKALTRAVHGEKAIP